MGLIQLLSEELSHKIAAGEVIERPASVVKELVENSLDAGATRIDIQIEEGGQEYIRISDDGSGIAPEDLNTAFMRHATSKIRSVDDLFAIQSLGFRGEALPSIASVSQMTLLTRIHDADSGRKAVVTSGSVQIIPAGSPPGTTVEVRQLFYNTPARYKFLKSPAAERRQVLDWVSRIAIAHPHAAFHLRADGRDLLETPGSGSVLDAIAAVHGWEMAKKLVPVEGQMTWGKIRGFLSRPQLTKGNRSDQLLVLNGRVIDAPRVMYSVERAYQGMLPHRRFPYLFLIVSIDPQQVDVNVHPAKSEVRFQNEQEISSAVYQLAKSALLESDLSIHFVGEEKSTAEKSVRPQQQELPAMLREVSIQPTGDPDKWSQIDALFSAEGRLARLDQYQPPLALRSERTLRMEEPSPEPGREQHESEANLPNHYKMQDVRPQIGSSSIGDAQDIPAANSPPTNSHKIRDQLLNGRIIGQLHQSYILLETQEGLWILDQHIIHERILFERFLHATHERPPVQQILPVSLELSAQASEAVHQSLEYLWNLGIELEEFGPQTFLLRGIPQELSRHSSQWEKDILRIAENTDEKSWQENAAITMACRGAIKAGDRLDEREIRSLLDRLAETENPFTCPHGRPIILRLERGEILRRFGRTP